MIDSLVSFSVYHSLLMLNILPVATPQTVASKGAINFFDIVFDVCI